MEHDHHQPEHRRARFHVRVPGFVNDAEVGVGDVIKRATSTVGVRPCGGCDRRAETLNRLLAVRRWRP